MRRLPVYLLIDTSGSMRGEAIQAVNVGLETMLATLRQDPFALESVFISILTFDLNVSQVLPLTELEKIQLPQINTPDSGPTHLGRCLQLLCEKVDNEVLKSTDDTKGDWRPLLFIMTDGKPSDTALYREMIPEVQKRNFGNIVACAAGQHAQESFLKELTTNVVSLDTTDRATFQQFFKWVSASVSVGNRSVGTTDQSVLPPPPNEVHIVI